MGYIIQHGTCQNNKELAVKEPRELNIIMVKGAVGMHQDASWPDEEGKGSTYKMLPSSIRTEGQGALFDKQQHLTVQAKVFNMSEF